MSDTNQQSLTKPALQHSMLIWVIASALIAAALWAYYYRIDEVVRGGGTVIAASRVQVSQTVDGGVIASLRVKEGDRVKAGQVLATLERSRVNASVREMEARLAAMKAQAARLNAEILESAEPEYPPEVQEYPELVEVQTALFKQRRTAIIEELRTLAVAVDLATEEEQLLRKLVEGGDASRAELIRASRALNDASAQLNNRRNKYLQEVRAELAKAEDDIAQVSQLLAQRDQQLKDTVLTASLPGVVKNIRVTTQGGVLRAGDELMQIIPVDDRLIVEAKVQPSDIAKVRPGLKASIRFDPFDYTVYGAVEGTVSYVSADTLREEVRGAEQTFYRVHVVTGSYPVTSQTGRTLDILPGMTAQIDIRTGNRTVMDYLLKPLRKTLAESFGER